MSLLKQIDSVQKDFEAELSSAIDDSSKLNSLHNKYLSRKGIVSNLFSKLPEVHNKEKPEIGKRLNVLRNKIEESFSKINLKDNNKSKKSAIDLTLPGNHFFKGSLHPITQVMNDISDIFKSIGFSIFPGDEVEDEFYNFEALNIPKYHPARDMQDTYYLNNEKLLRTHTSASQIHFMENNKPPIRIISPGEFIGMKI